MIIASWMIAAGWGCLGGLLRAGLGVDNAYREERKIIVFFLILTLIEAAVFGGVLGFFLKDYTPVYSFLAGVGGTSLLDKFARRFNILPVKIGG